MSQQKVLQTLVGLGLEQLDAEIYVFVAKKGPVKARNITNSLKISKQRLYPVLKNLQAKGIISATLEHPARFSALPFEKVLDLFIRAKMDEAQHVQKNKVDILSDWKSITISETDNLPPQFTVIEGRQYVYSKIQQMIQETKEHFSFVTTVPSLARADTFGLFDAAFNHPLKSTVHFRFITEVNEGNTKAVKCLLNKKSKNEFNLEGKTPDLGLKLCPRMVIKDNQETLFFIDSASGTSESDDVCLWTNCSSLVQAFIVMFEELWQNSTDIKRKIDEIEMGTLIPKTCVIADSETAYRKYRDALCSAKDEVIMLTSSSGLVSYCKDEALLNAWKKNGTSVKIMAPILINNFACAQQLLKFCQVRHVPRGYLGTTVIDEKHFFQLKSSSPSENEELQHVSAFENSFYTNDFEYVEKTKTMLTDMWNNSSTPSAIMLEPFIKSNKPFFNSTSKVLIVETLKKINGPIVENDKLSMNLTERDVLKKFISAQKTVKQGRNLDGTFMRFGTIAHAVIHPPRYFNLPDMLIAINHFEKHSAYGAEDAIVIMLKHGTDERSTFAAVAFIGDNPEAIDFWKQNFAGIPYLEQNIRLVRKDQIEVYMHGNSLFAGWTVPISLFPESCVLPPSAVLLEGIGDVRTGSYSVINPNGQKIVYEFNGFEAFVTFMNSSSNYAGPGTDGFIAREIIGTVYPM